MKRMILCFVLLFVADMASAQASFQFSVPNYQAPSDPNVSGMRFSLLHGKNVNVRGFDLGILSLSESSRKSGFGLVLGVDKVTQEMDGGAAFSLVNYHKGKDRGLNAAFINRVNDTSEAVTIGFVNIADGPTNFDLGGINVSESSNYQLGFINYTKKISGFQFGFVNIAENGFLPWFPVFNFPKN